MEALNTWRTSLRLCSVDDETVHLVQAWLLCVFQMNGNSSNFVTIRMKPDSQGRFGFNVKVCCRFLNFYSWFCRFVVCSKCTQYAARKTRPFMIISKCDLLPSHFFTTPRLTMLKCVSLYNAVIVVPYFYEKLISSPPKSLKQTFKDF